MIDPPELQGPKSLSVSAFVNLPMVRRESRGSPAVIHVGSNAGPFKPRPVLNEATVTATLRIAGQYSVN